MHRKRADRRHPMPSHLCQVRGRARTCRTGRRRQAARVRPPSGRTMMPLSRCDRKHRTLLAVSRLSRNGRTVWIQKPKTTGRPDRRALRRVRPKRRRLPRLLDRRHGMALRLCRSRPSLSETTRHPSRAWTQLLPRVSAPQPIWNRSGLCPVPPGFRSQYRNPGTARKRPLNCVWARNSSRQRAKQRQDIPNLLSPVKTARSALRSRRVRRSRPPCMQKFRIFPGSRSGKAAKSPVTTIHPATASQTLSSVQGPPTRWRPRTLRA